MMFVVILNHYNIVTIAFPRLIKTFEIFKPVQYEVLSSA